MMFSYDQRILLSAAGDLRCNFATSHDSANRALGRVAGAIRASEMWNRSAPMTTDAGVDLVAYSGVKGRAITLQVKTNLAPKPGDGRGALAVIGG
jgi:hypothetical protein